MFYSAGISLEKQPFANSILMTLINVNIIISGSYEVPNANLFNLTLLLGYFGKVLCSFANELQKNSNASSGEEHIPQILTALL